MFQIFGNLDIHLPPTLGLTNSGQIFLFELKHNHAYSAKRNRDKWRSGIFHVQMKHYLFFPLAFNLKSALVYERRV